MYTLKPFFLPLAAGMCLFAISCNNSTTTGQTSTDTTANANTSASNSSTATSSNIVTTPQNILVVMHKVANYEKWKMNYEGRDTARQRFGLHNFVIGRGLKDSNLLLVALKADDTAKAIAFMNDPGLKHSMARGGVEGKPIVTVYTAVWQDTSTIDSRLRSSVMFRVKDWNAWLKDFQEGAKERTENGVAVRSYGHDANDPNKVRVVTALIDSAKAINYFQSDALKKRMDASGVIGKPDRFLYRIAQRY